MVLTTARNWSFGFLIYFLAESVTSILWYVHGLVLAGAALNYKPTASKPLQGPLTARIDTIYVTM